uniref:Alanine acetyltransferase n=1 Tax=Tolypothrix bouteillei VB521301 TaxID=1479485 RepID=A0A0C1R711_9CYAN
MNESKLEIRALTSADLNEMVDLDRLCFGGLWTLDGYQRELDSPNSELLGIFSPVSVVKLLGMGCFWSILDEAHITILAVHPQHQRQGLGQALLYSLLKLARDRALERATLEVRASNSAAIALYQKFGFQTAGLRRRYYKDNDEDALILWLKDLQHPQFEQILENWYRGIGDRLREHNNWLLGTRD